MRPVVTPTSERLYARLAEVRRASDPDLDWPLLRYLAATGDQLDRVVVLLDRFNYVPPDEAPGGRQTADLVDPALADTAWLPFLSQIVGVRAGGLGTAALREAISGAGGGYLAGTRPGIAAAARTALTGTRYVAVYDHSISTPGNGGQWDVLVVTRSTETPSEAAVLAAIENRGARPAGVVIRVRSFTATWNAVVAAYPTWADIDGDMWQTIEEVGL